MNFRKALGTTVLVILLVVLIVVEDGLLWLGPRLSDSALRPSRIRTFETQCRKITLGMSMSHAVDTMSDGWKARYESYGRMNGQSTVRTLVFWQDVYRASKGDCIVSIDPDKGIVTEVRSGESSGPSQEENVIKFTH